MQFRDCADNDYRMFVEPFRNEDTGDVADSYVVFAAEDTGLDPIRKVAGYLNKDSVLQLIEVLQEFVEDN